MIARFRARRIAPKIASNRGDAITRRPTTFVLVAAFVIGRISFAQARTASAAEFSVRAKRTHNPYQGRVTICDPRGAGVSREPRGRRRALARMAAASEVDDSVAGRGSGQPRRIFFSVLLTPHCFADVTAMFQCRFRAQPRKRGLHRIALAEPPMRVRATCAAS